MGVPAGEPDRIGERLERSVVAQSEMSRLQAAYGADETARPLDQRDVNFRVAAIHGQDEIRKLL